MIKFIFPQVEITKRYKKYSKWSTVFSSKLNYRRLSIHNISNRTEIRTSECLHNFDLLWFLPCFCWQKHTFVVYVVFVWRKIMRRPFLQNNEYDQINKISHINFGFKVSMIQMYSCSRHFLPFSLFHFLLKISPKIRIEQYKLMTSWKLEVSQIYH